MILYHGSDAIVEKPDILHSKEHLDFGMGFYTTTVQMQAERWARRKAAIYGKSIGYVNIYELGESTDFVIRSFGDDLNAWIDFVCQCRAGSDIFRKYDVIMGKVANDKVIRVVDMYMRRLIDKEQAIKEIKVYETYDQIAFISQKAIADLLTFKESYEVKP